MKNIILFATCASGAINCVCKLRKTVGDASAQKQLVTQVLKTAQSGKDVQKL